MRRFRPKHAGCEPVAPALLVVSRPGNVSPSVALPTPAVVWPPPLAPAQHETAKADGGVSENVVRERETKELNKRDGAASIAQVLVVLDTWPPVRAALPASFHIPMRCAQP